MLLREFRGFWVFWVLCCFWVGLGLGWFIRGLYVYGFCYVAVDLRFCFPGWFVLFGLLGGFDLVCFAGLG